MDSGLEAFSLLVSKMVAEAISAREQSGIESRWLADLRQYYGGEWTLTQYNTAVHEAGMENRGDLLEKQKRSRIRVNITRPKTNAVWARLSDMLLPTDDRNWGLKPTPLPMLEEQLGNRSLATAGGMPVVNEDGSRATVSDVYEEVSRIAQKKCQAMERLIDDQLTQCNYNAEFRKGLWDLCVLGTMVMRGPFVRMSTKRTWKKAGDSWQLIIVEEEYPAAERVSPWNYYPDPACGGDIANARYHVERVEYNERTLRELRNQPGFIPEQIAECLSEGPKSVRRRGDRLVVPGQYTEVDGSVYEVYMVHGVFTRGQMADAGVEGCECEDDEQRLEAVSGCVFVCNNRVIKAYLNPLTTADMPYSVAQYETVEGQVFGVGVPFILREPQRVAVAGWRMMMDNAALAGGAQVVVNRQLIEPADGKWSINGTKVWVGKDGVEDVRAAFATYQIESRLSEIMAVVDRAMRFGEEESSMPALMEGSMANAPQTVGVATVLTNSANTILRRLVKTIDDEITDTLITRFYDYNMEHHPDDSVKGDFQVDARGTSVLLVRDFQQQALMMIGQFVTHPTLGRMHRRMGYDWLKAMYEAQHLDAGSILIDEAEVDAIVEQPEQSAPPPQIAVAQIRAESEQAKVAATMEDRERERQHDMQRLQLEYELQMIRYANENRMKVEDVKTKLTELLMSQRHEQTMQEREIAIKSRMGSGL